MIIIVQRIMLRIFMLSPTPTHLTPIYNSLYGLIWVDWILDSTLKTYSWTEHICRKWGQDLFPPNLLGEFERCGFYLGKRDGEG